MKVTELDRIEYKRMTRKIKDKLLSNGLNGLQLEKEYTKMINSDINHAIKFLNS